MSDDERNKKQNKIDLTDTIIKQKIKLSFENNENNNLKYDEYNFDLLNDKQQTKIIKKYSEN